MSLRLLIISVSVFCIAGCATVDIADMASGGQTQAVNVSSEKNVVIKATDALEANFQTQAWEQTSTVDRFKSAANVLLRGMRFEEQNIASANGSPTAKKVTLMSLRADILEAGKDVAKTVKAAEIYLEVADPQAELNAELKALEKAFMSSRRAENWFEKSLKKIDGVDVDLELSSFAASVDRLRESTNQYGDRVRERARAAKAPAS